ncbi:crossover junction endodeoxyribonuclease RuvC [Bacillus thuringiensis]|uniref:crossover junction endodeoxyribonuclease RuvC n=1 Tax=Bacillus thuringiensis TaxID=1428 RepID=UPI002DBC52B4|nr:crossover junction endodeoxyribonuclease RuvC [Bacillus thuringiensis]MEC3459870.1 crossover junction endodeoxyribonuclease RuvC [Bacillus thuringiensis]
MYYLGLDPSTKCTGYCVMDEKHDNIEARKIDRPSKGDEGDKIIYQIERIEALFEKYDITKILCEDQFSKINIDTLKKLTRVSGTILNLAKKHKLEIELIYHTS